ncbi:tyrosine-type recombinase/integrase [uncultured Butyricimonas sp.]|uniref:tyrosine-type recombinase/integrase n=1 Tax=uncultured Butyricimonas sp. TaxID=1268785 RepID=UPI0026DB0576|nr:tyrosine-type recombinase/integrase [uncultured Butyricimonas sp.]
MRSNLSVVYNRHEIMSVHRNDKTVLTVLVDFIREYMAKSHRPDHYKRMYLIAANHLSAFGEYIEKTIYTNTLNDEGLQEFVHFLQEQQNLMSSTVKGMIERVKAMLQRAYNGGYPVDPTFRDFIYRDDEINTIFLSMTDIARLYYFRGLKKNQEIVRDYFIIGCMTALRYSDYSRLTKDNFFEGKISIRTKKTKAPVVVPVHKFVREIMEKYNWELPKAKSIQYFNKVIKEICKKVGFTELIPYERRKGLYFTTTMRPKYELISSHTARRSAATNMFLSGIPTLRIMKITAHRSEQIFYKYIKISNEENAITLSAHQFFN